MNNRVIATAAKRVVVVTTPRTSAPTRAVTTPKTSVPTRAVTTPKTSAPTRAVTTPRTSAPVATPKPISGGNPRPVSVKTTATVGTTPRTFDTGRRPQTGGNPPQFVKTTTTIQQQTRYGVVCAQTGTSLIVQTKYGVVCASTTLQTKYGVISPPTPVQPVPKYGVPVRVLRILHSMGFESCHTHR